MERNKHLVSKKFSKVVKKLVEEELKDFFDKTNVPLPTNGSPSTYKPDRG